MQRMALISNSSANVVEGSSSANISAGNGSDRSSVATESTANAALPDLATVTQLASNSPNILNEVAQQSSPHIDITNHQRISPNCSFRGQTN